MNFSFKFSKSVKPVQLKDSKLRDESTKDTDKDVEFVNEIDGTTIKGCFKEEEKEEDFVIPLIKKNCWRKLAKVEKTYESSNVSKVNVDSEKSEVNIDSEKRLELQAIKELCNGGNGVESEDDDIAIPLLLQNKIPDGYETDHKIDTSLRAKESNLEDYERCPIEKFGLGMLRGMGWKEGDGVGLRNPKDVPMLEPKLRPKGLGLGAEMPNKNTDTRPSGAKNGEKQLCFKVGGYVMVTNGANAKKYGQILSFDEDNNRVMVKMALSNEIVTTSKFCVKLVSEQDYKKSSRVINNAKYEEYKNKEDRHSIKSQEKTNRRHDRSRSRSIERTKDRNRNRMIVDEDTYASKGRDRSSERYKDHNRRSEASRDRRSHTSHHRHHLSSRSHERHSKTNRHRQY